VSKESPDSKENPADGRKKAYVPRQPLLFHR